MHGLALLRERVTLLDRESTGMKVGRPDPLGADLDAFIRVMSRITAGGPIAAVPTISPELADETIGESALISRLREAWQGIVDGPVNFDCQQWVATQPPPYRPSRAAVLAEHEFVAVDVFENLRASTKPFEIGLHTSTSAAQQPGMWLRYLELHRGSSLFGRSWTVWRVRISDAARVLEVCSARDWATLVSRYPLERGGATYPDWKNIAADWDGVHVTVSAVAAIQGLRFDIGRSTVAAPSYWDVESTFWLRWVVELAEQVEHIDTAVL